MEPFTCPRCKVILILPDHYAGASFSCPNCQLELRVPGGNAGTEADREAEVSDESSAGETHQRGPDSLRTVLLAATSSRPSWLT